MILAVVDEETRGKEGFHGGVFHGGIQVTHEDEGVFLMGASHDRFQDEFSGLDPRGLALVIPVSVVDVDGASSFGASDSNQACPGADAGIAISPGPAVCNVWSIG